MEIIHNPETNQSPKAPPKGSNSNKDHHQIQSQVSKIKLAEKESEKADFLTLHQIDDSKETRILLDQILEERRLFESDFSLPDFSTEDLDRLRKVSQLNIREKQLENNTNSAKSAENLVDQLKSQGLSNYEVLQKLLDAQETGQVRLLAKKYASFKKFFSFLDQAQFGTSDTSRILETINQSDIDLTAPDAFETIIFSIYEDDRISNRAKEKIRQKFKLFPIVTGDDLKENLRIKRQQVKVLKRQRISVSETLNTLNIQSEEVTEELQTLKEKILTEQDSDKKLKLEKQYDRLEEKLKKLKKEKASQEELAKGLKEQNITSTVSVRGAKADMQEGEILVTIPGTKTQVSIPNHLSSQAIAKAVNAYLVNEALKPLGLESYFFYQSDFEEGKYPYSETLDWNDLFLFKLGFASDTQILTAAHLKELKKLLNVLMRPDEYRVDLTARENATMQLNKLGLLEQGELDSEQMVSEFLRIKRSR